MPLFLPGIILALFKSRARVLYKISLISVLFPEPETPVTQTSLPSGIFTFTFLRLFSAAPRISINFPLPSLRFSGTGITLLWLRYWPVIDFSQALISSTSPTHTISPPCTPAPGPTSTIQSAAYIVSSSCSTTITVLPKSRSLLSVLKSFSLSRWCKPILGSSRI